MSSCLEVAFRWTPAGGGRPLHASVEVDGVALAQAWLPLGYAHQACLRPLRDLLTAAGLYKPPGKTKPPVEPGA